MSTAPSTDRPPAPRKSRRRPLLIGLAVLVVVLVVAAIVGPKIYASMESDKAAAPLTSSTASGSAASTPTAASTDTTLDGTWAVASGGTAGYRVNEVLNGNDVTVTGRTSDVTGSLTVADGSLTAANVSVNLATVATDSDQRDNQFRTRVIDTTTYPTADFVLTSPVLLGGLETGSTISVDLVGTLTIHGVTKDVTVPATVERTADDSVTVTGSSDVTWSDYGVEAPNLGFVSVEDAGTIEFSVVANPS